MNYNKRITRITTTKYNWIHIMDCYYGSLKEKIPAHVIIPQKPKKEDTGTYDNTSEVSDNITEA